jgi:hypothetical protein
MTRNIAIAAVIVAALVGTSVAAMAEETVPGVTVLRGNTITTDGTVIGVGTGGVDTAPTNPANAYHQSGNVNELRTGSANAGGEIGNLSPGLGR